jgi:hypothetical protein
MLHKKKPDANGVESIETRSSSMFTKINYTPDKKGNLGVLRVVLVNHTEYEYWQIPRSLWNRFKAAGSYGSFWNTYIKNVYQYTRKL